MEVGHDVENVSSEVLKYENLHNRLQNNSCDWFFFVIVEVRLF